MGLRLTVEIENRHRGSFLGDGNPSLAVNVFDFVPLKILKTLHDTFILSDHNSIKSLKRQKYN